MQSENIQNKILQTALLAGQIMCESNAESYRVEDTMNRILTYSNAAYAVAISFSTGIFVTLDDDNFESGAFVGMRRITRRTNNLNKISLVNNVSRDLVAHKITVDEALIRLTKIRYEEPQYATWLSSIGVIGLSVSFCVTFGGDLVAVIGAFLTGVLLALAYILNAKYYVNSAFQNVVQAACVTVFANVLGIYIFPKMDVNIVIISTLMPMVPGTAITNALRDIFHEDYIAGSARAMEAFFEALMIAIGSIVGFAILRGTIW